MEAMKLLFLQLLAVACYAENIDTLQPIMRISPDPAQNGSLFGYSLALHQIAAVSPGNPSQAMMNTRIVVSDPKRTTIGGQLEHTGAVYVCPVEPGACEHSSYPRLYDTEGNSGNENKMNQFLGASMASNGEHLLVCAHRYNIDGAWLIGRCFASSNRSLSDFEDFQPCTLVDALRKSSAGLCQAGTSSVILPGPVYGLGAPGYYYGLGNFLSMTNNTASDIQRFQFSVNDATLDDTYLGYATTSGYFSNLSRLDYAVSIPRIKLYTGVVVIIVRDSSLTLVSQPALRGIQMGEGYGFSVLGANLLGDNYSELLVGAPFYRAYGSHADAGRVFIYSNNRGSLSLLRIIVGFKAFSRFGYAMANLGDISGDGYDDIAIGAPFSSTGESGVVYIYHSSSSQGLTLNYQQAIIGSKLSLSGVSFPGLGFGAALVSGIDVDGNTYNDLAIGAFESQRVFLLRTRPIAKTITTFTVSPQIVDLDANVCPFDGQMHACFNITACAQYSGNALSDQLTYKFNLTADTRSIEKRIIFSSMASTILEFVEVSHGPSPICQLYTAYVVNGIVDRFNPIFVNFGVTIPQLVIQEGSGNLPLQSFNDYPVLKLIGNREVQVETLKDCNGIVCIPDLKISVEGTNIMMMNGSTQQSDTIVVGGVRNVQINLEVHNAGEDAFHAAVKITIPTELVFGKVVGTFSNNAVETLTCSDLILNENVVTSSRSCSIGNPFMGPNNSIIVTVIVTPRKTLRGNEGNLEVRFSATSFNPENNTTLNDGSNEAFTILKTAAQTDITLDSPGIVSPEQLTYSRVPPNGSITRVDQLGPTFSVSFVVRNSGPSTVTNIKLVIYWPLNSTNSDGFYYLYPAEFSTSETGSTITCSNENINPERTLSLAEGNQQNGEDTMTGRGGKRRKRSIPQRISKRQNTASQVDLELSTTNQTISCADSGPVLNCVPIECDIIGLQGSTQTRVNIIGYVDERFFSKSVDRFSIIPNAMVAIVGEEFIKQPNPDKGKNATATVRLIPAVTVAIGGRRAVPWWVIVLPILAAIIVTIIITVILWAFGFFKRSKYEEIKQRREEMENLEKHGITAGEDLDGSTENILTN